MPGYYDEELEPKPFAKVVFKDAKRRPFQAEKLGHDRFGKGKITGQLVCRWRNLTPLHIGSGLYELDSENNPMRGAVVEGAGRAFLPGTSLKGVIRSIAEAISDSCVRVAHREIKRALPQNVTACGEVKSRHRKDIEYPRLCACCALFGAPGYQGRVSFSDARLVSGGLALWKISAAYSPRPAARGYQDARGQLNGRKFYYHGKPVLRENGEPCQVLKAGSQMEGTLFFENLSQEELCLVLVAMGVLDDVKIKLGGGKQAMLGSAEVLPVRLELQVADAFADFDAGPQVITDNLVDYLLDWVGSASGLLNETTLEELTEVWAWPSQRHTPTGPY